MMPVSSRYLVPLLTVLVASSVPVVIHRYVGFLSDECADPSALRDPRGIAGSRRAEELPNKHTRLRFQWTEGQLAPYADGQPPLRFRIVRSFEPRNFYLEPSRFIPRFVYFDRPELRWIDAGTERIPIHTLYDQSEGIIRYSAYMIVYESRPVDYPFLAGLASAGAQLVRGARPLSYFLVHGVIPLAHFEAAERAAAHWLTAARGYYRVVCSP